MNRLDLRTIARILGGEVTGGQVLAPALGHSAKDRSLSVKFDPKAPNGFIVHCFGKGDPIACKDYVREKLGLSPWQPGQGKANGKGNGREYDPVVKSYIYRNADGAP